MSQLESDELKMPALICFLLILLLLSITIFFFLLNAMLWNKIIYSKCEKA